MLERKIIILFFLSILCKYSSELGCTRCNLLNANFCCKVNSVCCAASNSTTGTGATTAGFCPTPIPRIPPQGLLARTCSNDAQCPYGFKCCPIIQAGTGTTYQICTAPSFNANAAIRTGFCPSPVPLIPPQGITARLCSSDEDCATDLRCCSVLQNSTGRFFQICSNPVLIPQVQVTTPPRPTTPTGAGTG